MPAEDPKSFVHDVTPERMGFYFCMRDLADYLKDQWPDNKEEDFCIKEGDRFTFDAPRELVEIPDYKTIRNRVKARKRAATAPQLNQ